MRTNVSKFKSGLVAALDIGSTKVSCCVAHLNERQNLKVLGIGHQVSKGMKRGTIVDMDAVENSVLNAVHSAELMAGQTVEHVIVSISTSQLLSFEQDYTISVGGSMIDDHHVRMVLDSVLSRKDLPNYEVIHAIPLSFRVDDQSGIFDPRGMYGKQLCATIHVIAASSSQLRNLETLIARSHLNCLGIVAAPIASALSTLVEDESELGAVLVDIGGGVTDIAAFKFGASDYLESVPVGGAHITNDIAQGLSTPISFAERLKTLYGSALISSSDDAEMIVVPQIGDDEETYSHQIPRSHLVQVIQARAEEIFRFVREVLHSSDAHHLNGRKIVLTGGASQLPGMRELATQILARTVRVAKPKDIAAHLSEMSSDASFATCAGLLIYLQKEMKNMMSTPSKAQNNNKNFFGRITSWLKQNV